MKKLLLSSVALAGLTATAMAADLPSRRAPAPYVAVPVFTWTGFYAGVNAGYAFSDNSNNGRFGTFAVGPGTFTDGLGGYTGVASIGGAGNRSQDGFSGGGQVGYNYQIGNFVIGIEADAQYADLSRRRTGSVVTLTPTPATFVGAVNSNFGGIDFFGTVRGRVGYAWDRVLVYGTGGFAYGDGGTSGNQCLLANGTFAAGCNNGRNDLRTGYAAGGGVEYAFTPNIIGRVEGMYVSLDRNRSNNLVGTFGGTPVYFNGNSRNNDDSFAVVRAGVSYKFNTF